mgnify:CR=1 FL=1
MHERLDARKLKYIFASISTLTYIYVPAQFLVALSPYYSLLRQSSDSSSFQKTHSSTFDRAS